MLCTLCISVRFCVYTPVYLCASQRVAWVSTFVYFVYLCVCPLWCCDWDGQLSTLTCPDSCHLHAHLY